MKFPRDLILVSLDWTRPKDPPLSLGHASLLANIKHQNITVSEKSWAVNSDDFSHHQVTDFIMQHASDNSDVGLGAFVWNEKAVQNILNDLRRYQFPGRVILGGPQVSYVKQGLENFYPQADIFVRGYADTVLTKLMQSGEDFPDIKGVHYANQPDLGFSAVPELDNAISPFLSGIIQLQRFIRWETQRGCSFRCAFCQHREPNDSMKRRNLSLPRVMQEVDWITQHPEIQDIAVLDPIFNSGPYYLAILQKLHEGKYRGKLALQCRLEMVKKEFLDAIEQLNKTGEVVLEFGLQTIHPHEQKIIDRLNNMKRVEEVLSEVRKRKITCEISLIFGLPQQTVSSFSKSIEFCKLHQVPIIHAFPLMLLRGTPLYHQKKSLGLIESCEIASDKIDRIQIDIPHVVASPSFTYEEWREMADLAASLEHYNKTNTENINSKKVPIYQFSNIFKMPEKLKQPNSIVLRNDSSIAAITGLTPWRMNRKS